MRTKKQKLPAPNYYTITQLAREFDYEHEDDIIYFISSGYLPIYTISVGWHIWEFQADYYGDGGWHCNEPDDIFCPAGKLVKITYPDTITLIQDKTINTSSFDFETKENIKGKRLFDKQLNSDKHPEGIEIQLKNVVIKDEDVKAFINLPPPPLTPQQKSAQTKGKNQILKIMMGLVKDAGYGYDPRANKSDVAPKIRDDLLRNGVKMDEGKIRDYLAEAADIMPEEFEFIDGN